MSFWMMRRDERPRTPPPSNERMRGIWANGFDWSVMRKGPQMGIYFGDVVLPCLVMSSSDGFLVQESKRPEKRRSPRSVAQCLAGLASVTLIKIWSAPPPAV